MATFQSFEEIEAWGKARELTRQIYMISNQGLFAKDFGLRDQIRRASVSIISNIAEGFEISRTIPELASKHQMSENEIWNCFRFG